MEIKIYQVDAFASHVFKGNPAAVCPLVDWLPDKVLQNMAMENNLSETAFYVKEKDGFRIRWFTPTVEVNLCGHATLATAFVLFHYEGHTENKIDFHSQSGLLSVTKSERQITLNFPTDSLTEVHPISELEDSLGAKPKATYKGKTDYLVVFDSETQIRELQPNFKKMADVNARGIIVTARGEKVDFVSRFFAPQSGIDEDPVTGSAHTTLVPYWAGVLHKNNFTAQQLSVRGGELICQFKGDRIEIGGEAQLYLQGKIFI